jgi:hypothetical protein
LILLSLSISSHAQLWNGILQTPSSCSPTATTTPGLCAYSWQDYTGIPGGIPDANWTQSGSTITSTGSNQTSAINSALSSCGTNHYVLLGGTPSSPQTFQISGQLTIPATCVLRGGGATATILNMASGTYAAVSLGAGGVTAAPSFSSPITVSNANAGGTTITVSSTSGLSVGTLLMIDQLQDGVTVSNVGTEGICTWCDAGQTGGGTRQQGQIDRISAINGPTVTLEMPLMVSYTLTPLAVIVPANYYSGLENLQIYQGNAGSTDPQINMVECAYCWISGVENNYAAADHIDADWSYRGEIVSNYFSNDFLHTAGCCDSDVDLRYKTTGFRVENNIFERLHTSLMLEWGAAGNVIAYNLSTGNFDSGSTLPSSVYAIQDVAFHGSHPQFNLFEGNVVNTMGQDGIWGSSANNTAFRNWSMGTGEVCLPLTGRGTVNCTGSSGALANQAAKSFDLNAPNHLYFIIGNVEGSTQQSTLGTGYALAVAVCGSNVPSGTPCGAKSRQYQAAYYNETFGYGTTGDTGTQPIDNDTPWNTSFIHGEYGTVNNSITWVSGVTHTLPNSFYLTSAPSWWTSSIPWPAIGPDVANGNGPGGHVYSTTAANPAENCYYNVMRGVYGGAGSPYSFNANTCYSSGPAPAAPTGLTAIVH